MDFIIRKYKDEDYDAVFNIIFNSLGYKKEKIKNDKSFEFVCEYNSKVIGYFILNEMIDIVRNLKIYHIDYVCVDKDYRGRGFGTEMMKYAIEYAKENGVARVELTSGNQRESAHKLYLSLGFVKRDTSVFRKELL